MKPHFNPKLLKIGLLLNLLSNSIVSGQWHYPSQFEPPPPLQQQSPSQQIKNHLKKVLEPFIPPLPKQIPAPPPPPPPGPNKRAAILQPTPPITLYPPPATPPAEPTAPRCGEFLNLTSSGIFHSPFKPVLENERCVWTVLVPGASGYQIDVLYIGWDPKNNNKDGISNHVLVNGFKRGITSTELSITGKGVHSIKDATLLVVTFITGTNPGNTTMGFILQYTTLTTGSVHVVSANSLQQFILPETSYLKHPTSTTQFYQNNELSTFVFLPTNNTHVADQKVNLVYMKIGLDVGKCEDYVDVYGLNVTSTAGQGIVGNNAKWDFKGRICGYLETQLIDNTDLLMMIFWTDALGTNFGFHLTHTVC